MRLGAGWGCAVMLVWGGVACGGEPTWAIRWGVLIPGPAQETFSGIAVDSTGGIWMAGYFEDRFDVGLGPVTGAGASNWALWRFVED